jgi:hypothetical protein
MVEKFCIEGMQNTAFFCMVATTDDNSEIPIRKVGEKAFFSSVFLFVFSHSSQNEKMENYHLLFSFILMLERKIWR